MERKEYQLQQAEMDKILSINKEGGDPVIYLSGGVPMGRSLQEKINDYWETLGEKYGFKSTTVQPSDKGELYFTAEPLKSNKDA